MTAAYITAPGPAEAIRVGELPVPKPGPTDVLVRTQALAANHVDTFVRSGAYATPLPMPFVIGRDLVGVVAAAGARVAGFGGGDAVWCNSSVTAGGRDRSPSTQSCPPTGSTASRPASTRR
jgi:NADPH:quinone reductase-like Zn-dependent oxidoreductase